MKFFNRDKTGNVSFHSHKLHRSVKCWNKKFKSKPHKKHKMLRFVLYP